jgi:hypothetical protein
MTLPISVSSLPGSAFRSPPIHIRTAADTSAVMLDDARIVEALSSLRGGAKRRASSDPIEKWYPYYAGYSLEFAETVLHAAGLPPNAIVLDPWNGSGTTTLAAARLGLRAYGIDLNPFAVLVARARLVSPLDARGARGFVRETAGSSPRPSRIAQDDPLREWLAPAEVAELRRIHREIVQNLGTPEGEPLGVDHNLFPPLASFLLLALVRAARSRVRTQPASNPTIFRASPPRWRKDAAQTLAAAWSEAAIAMGDELMRTSSTPEEPWIRVGDARALPAAPSSIDFVLTSPPYCTRLDYGASTRFELAVIAPERMLTFPKLRRELMGAPLVRSAGKPEIPVGWPASVRELLDRIRRHKSKASDSYYYKTYHQYFADADAALGAIAAALKPGASAALVVQGSYYKEVKVDLAALYADLAARRRLRLHTLHRIPVRTVLSTIHPGTQKYRRHWSYDESLVLLQKEKTA